MDVDDVPMFGEMMLLLGISRVLWRIRPFVRLPDFKKKFDLITAFMLCFNGHKTPGLWGVEAWRFFPDDLAPKLRPRGRVFIEFNREDDGSFYSDELRDLFLARGAQINRRRILFPPAQR